MSTMMRMLSKYQQKYNHSFVIKKQNEVRVGRNINTTRLMCSGLAIPGSTLLGLSLVGGTSGIYHFLQGQQGLQQVPVIPAEATHVYLDGNEISDIGPGVFHELNKCIYMNLGFNHLTEIRPDMWEGLNSLKTLILYVNEIHHISDGAFSTLPAVRSIYLNHNKLKVLSRTVFGPNHPHRLDLHLGDNPLQCDSKLCWMEEAEVEGWLKVHSAC